MRIWNFVAWSEIDSTRRLKEAAIERGHEARVVDYARLYMNITSIDHP